MNASDLLADVRSRALVSSEDRPAWLAARALGVTATEVAKLRNGGKDAETPGLRSAGARILLLVIVQRGDYP